MVEVPRLVVVGGPNGSGKTTFARKYAEIEGLAYLGADDIAVRLSPEDPQEARVRAGRVFAQELSRALDAGASLVVESTLSGGSFTRYLSRARKNGYAVKLVFVFLSSPELCLERIAARVARGEHNVPEADVRRRYGRSLRRFWRDYRGLADDWLLLDNSGGAIVQVASGSGGGTTIHDEEVWARVREAGVSDEEEDENGIASE